AQGRADVLHPGQSRRVCPRLCGTQLRRRRDRPPHHPHDRGRPALPDHARRLAFVGNWAYDAALFINTYFNIVRRWLGFEYWSFSAWAKLKVKNAVNHIGAFESALAEEAVKEGADGVVCGHIHHPALRDMHGIAYVNIGDFVESCTVAAEHDDGRIEIVQWKVPLAVVKLD